VTGPHPANTLWQEDTLLELKAVLQSFRSISAAFVVGSLANEAVQEDYWSDIDLIVVVTDQVRHQFYSDTAWLAQFPPLFAVSRSQDPPRYTLRVCFSDMRRIDFIFILESAFQVSGTQELDRFDPHRRILFSRSIEVDPVLSENTQTILPLEEQSPDSQFSELSNDFWFKGSLAVYKIVRNDLLIAFHLALDLIRDCLVVKMMLRDRTEGTTRHRIGGLGNDLVAHLTAQPIDSSPGGLLALIESTSQSFETLVDEWSPEAAGKSRPLLGWIRQARVWLSTKESAYHPQFRS